MAKISAMVSITLFSILGLTIIIILNVTGGGAIGAAESESTRVGLILNGVSDDRSWGQSHYDSLMRISGELNLVVVCRENVPEDERCADVIADLVENEKCSVVIADSYGFGDQIEKAADKYRNIYFFHTAGSGSGRNLCSYFGRMYQYRYLSGIIAGLQTKTNTIGYTAAFPIDEVNRGISAFALGVRSVNPEAQIVVSFCGSWTDEDSARVCSEKLITGYGADVLAMHTNSLSPLEVADKYGIWSIGYNLDNSASFPDSCLTACVWEWDSYYKEQILACIQGKFHGEHKWLGMESGIMKLVDPAAVGNAKSGYEEYLRSAEKRFRERSFDVFYGPVTDNEGVLRVPEGESMSDSALLDSFGWYAEGVRIV